MAVSTSARNATRRRSSNGRDKTHWRTGTCGVEHLHQRHLLRRPKEVYFGGGYLEIAKAEAESTPRGAYNGQPSRPSSTSPGVTFERTRKPVLLDAGNQRAPRN